MATNPPNSQPPTIVSTLKNIKYQLGEMPVQSTTPDLASAIQELNTLEKTIRKLRNEMTQTLIKNANQIPRS